MVIAKRNNYIWGITYLTIQKHNYVGTVRVYKGFRAIENPKIGQYFDMKILKKGDHNKLSFPHPTQYHARWENAFGEKCH